MQHDYDALRSLLSQGGNASEKAAASIVSFMEKQQNPVNK
jgi:hypothetical protein